MVIVNSVYTHTTVLTRTINYNNMLQYIESVCEVMFLLYLSLAGLKVEASPSALARAGGGPAPRHHPRSRWGRRVRRGSPGSCEHHSRVPQSACAIPARSSCSTPAHSDTTAEPIRSFFPQVCTSPSHSFPLCAALHVEPCLVNMRGRQEIRD